MNTPHIRSQTALVTGAGKRIGKEIALTLAKAGYHVALHYGTSQAEAAKVRDMARTYGVKAEIFPCDLANPVAVARLIPQVREAFPDLCALVNNASVFEPDDFLTYDEIAAARQMQINAHAPIALIRAFSAALQKEKQKGAIVNLLDQRVLRPAPGFFSYSASKAFLSEVGKILAVTLAPNVRINGVSPGPVLPNCRQSPEEFAVQAGLTPLGCAVTAEEIAEASLFLLRSPAVTGMNIVIDAGQSADWRTQNFMTTKE